MSAKKAIISFIFFVLLVSCIDENPDLVNPPPQVESVRIRLFNGAADAQPRALQMDGMVTTAEAAYNNITAAVQPPADSVNAVILYNGNEEFAQTRKFKFVRNTAYTAFALPSVPGDSAYRNMDTIILMPTLTGLLEKPQKAFIKLMNAYPDTATSYFLNLGCPSGPSLASNVFYRGLSSHSEIRSGEVSVTLQRKDLNGITTVGLYRLLLDEFKQYAMIVSKNRNTGSEDVFLLDEREESEAAMILLEADENRNTNIRLINFSQTAVEIRKLTDSTETVITDLNPMMIGAKNSVATCETTTPDTINTYISGNLLSHAGVSFEVNENYSVLVFDKDTADAALTVITEPIRLLQSQGNRAVVRVVNAVYNQPGITVSLGARDGTNVLEPDLGYISGEVLGNEMVFGEIYDPVLLEPGAAPITVFSSTQPAYFLHGILTALEPEQSYLLVIYNDPDGKVQATLINETSEDEPITPNAEGVFMQIVNAVTETEYLEANLAGIVTAGRIYYTGTMASIVNPGPLSMTLGGMGYSPEAELGKRLLVVASGNSNGYEMFHISSKPMLVGNYFYKYRFINASPGVSMSVRVDSEEGEFTAFALPYKEVSAEFRVEREKKISLYFADENSGEILTRAELFLNFGKNYTIILSGSKTGMDINDDGFDDGFTVIVQQEF